VGEAEHGEAAEQQSHDDEAARVGFAGEVSRDRHRQQGADTARRECQPGVVRRIAEQGLQVDRQQYEAGVEDKAELGNQEYSGGEGAVAQGAEVDHGIARLELPDDQRQEAADAENCEHADVGGFEPVVLLARIEDDLKRAQAEREEADAPEVDASGAAVADVVRIEDEAGDHQDR